MKDFHKNRPEFVSDDKLVYHYERFQEVVAKAQAIGVPNLINNMTEVLMIIAECMFNRMVMETCGTCREKADVLDFAVRLNALSELWKEKGESSDPTQN